MLSRMAGNEILAKAWRLYEKREVQEATEMIYRRALDDVFRPSLLLAILLKQSR